LDLIQEVLLINPHYAEVYLGFATFCVTQRLYQQSVDYSKKAIEINPSCWKAYSGLGINLLRLAEEGPAKDALEKAYQNDPFNVWTVNSLRLIDSDKNFDRLETTPFVLKLHKKKPDPYRIMSRLCWRRPIKRCQQSLSFTRLDLSISKCSQIMRTLPCGP
jgi:tetratricopeptide (TPR) repeat protein